jgi:hypothetical protein
MRLAPFCLLAAVALTNAYAQARPDCAVRPATLAEMRGCYRPLLVFAATADDPRLKAQQDALDNDADDMMDRNVLLVPVVESGKGLQLPLDAPYVVLPSTESEAARKRFGVAPGSFEVVLLGEDGGAKLRSGTPVATDRLNGLIDSMPTRRIEMQRPHSN